ncbi:MAG: alpha/beta hydrolase [Fimbriimonas sp.]|nr:alpha/beta hydrolase [Fimbriimonas sp.]
MRRSLVAGSVGIVLAALVSGGCARLLARSLLSRHSAGQRASSSLRGEESVIGGISVSIWNPKGETGPAPLVLFSHGFHGSSNQSKFLTSALADHGYLVVAPEHSDSSMYRHGAITDGLGEFKQGSTWTDRSHEDRVKDFRKLIGAMKADPHWSRAVDWKKVAIVGHSLGGYTALGIGGAWPTWRIADVKAVIALSPFCAPYVQHKTLSHLQAPVMYQGGTRDFGITPTVIKGGAAFDSTPSPAYYVELEGAGHFAWTDLNRRYQPSIVHYCEAFLDRYLRGDITADLTEKEPDVSLLRKK